MNGIGREYENHIAFLNPELDEHMSELGDLDLKLTESEGFAGVSVDKGKGVGIRRGVSKEE